MLTKSFIQAFGVGLAVIYVDDIVKQTNPGERFSTTMNVLTCYGVGKALKIFTYDYEFFFRSTKLARFSSFLILVLVSTLIALFNLSCYWYHIDY